MLQVTYVQHSCFVVEVSEAILVFDYFSESAIAEIGYQGKMPPLNPDKQIYVFASHSHKDHFSLEVLRWAKVYPHITYILSKDIRLGKNYLLRNHIPLDIREHIRFVTPKNVYQVDGLRIETLRSTDAGVAFVVEVEGMTFYHAGDLHWWNGGERDELYAQTIGAAYKKEIRCLSNYHIDVAFVVLDPRMGSGYYLGMEYFLLHVDADVVFPMHLWRDYALITRFKRRPETIALSKKVVELDRENIIFRLEDETTKEIVSQP